MSETERHILEFAKGHSTFTSSELASATPDTVLQSRATLEWYLSQLTREGKLGRIGKGRYSAKALSLFVPDESETDKDLAAMLRQWYPDATFCIYKGTVFAPLQHHLSYNALTYIETRRELTEALFHRLRDEGRLVFHRPDKKVFYDYVDISQPGLIIKPLVSGSPLQVVGGVTLPMLEKLLVDIRCDADFDYLGGGESFRMLENAASLFTFNTTKLLRYAGRRHCRKEFENDLKLLNYDTQRMLHPRMDSEDFL